MKGDLNMHVATCYQILVKLKTSIPDIRIDEDELDRFYFHMDKKTYLALTTKISKIDDENLSFSALFAILDNEVAYKCRDTSILSEYVASWLNHIFKKYGLCYGKDIIAIIEASDVPQSRYKNRIPQITVIDDIVKQCTYQPTFYVEDELKSVMENMSSCGYSLAYNECERLLNEFKSYDSSNGKWSPNPWNYMVGVEYDGVNVIDVLLDTLFISGRIPSMRNIAYCNAIDVCSSMNPAFSELLSTLSGGVMILDMTGVALNINNRRFKINDGIITFGVIEKAIIMNPDVVFIIVTHKKDVNIINQIIGKASETIMELFPTPTIGDDAIKHAISINTNKYNGVIRTSTIINDIKNNIGIHDNIGVALTLRKRYIESFTNKYRKLKFNKKYMMELNAKRRHMYDYGIVNGTPYNIKKELDNRPINRFKLQHGKPLSTNCISAETKIRNGSIMNEFTLCDNIDIVHPKSISPEEELKNLIGLSDVKVLVNQIINHYCALKRYEKNGINIQAFSRHMAFYGNPGTAKTTVARILFDILKNRGIVTAPELIEVGRGDLIGRYMGWTAQMVQDAFAKASGGILFIDEAYSICQSDNDQYGAEALATIVQEMENHRDDVIVIFAGYKDELNQFISTNPGLRSRIAFSMEFPDYTVDELIEIASHITTSNGFILDDGAKSYLKENIKIDPTNRENGNGRYIRNVIEKAIISHSNRVITDNIIEGEPLKTITLTDISNSSFGAYECKNKQTPIETRPIGFVC